MSGLTAEAADLVGRMVAAGWTVSFRARPTLGPVWWLVKIVSVPGLGEFVRAGQDADLGRAVEKALADERRGGWPADTHRRGA